MPVFAFLDANARTGPSMPPHILEIDDVENANTALFREFAHMILRCLQRAVVIEETKPHGLPPMEDKDNALTI